MTEPDGSRDLDSFEGRLEAAKGKMAPPPRQIATSALGHGLRYAMEIVVGTIVGGGIGWLLDGWLGTRPWLAILFLLVGLVAGFANLVRAVNREAENLRSAEDTDGAGRGEDRQSDG